MKDGPLAKRYAKALFRAASEAQILEQVSDEINAVADSLRENISIAAILFSPSIEKTSKEVMVNQLSKDRFSNLTHQFLLLLVKKGRLPLIPVIVREFEKYGDKILRRSRVKATSAVPVSRDEEQAIKSVLEKALNSQVKLEIEENPEILGGLIIDINGKVVDASLRFQLSRMRDNLRG